jgi:hypothetical protein
VEGAGHTLRELDWMARGKQADEWYRGAAFAAFAHYGHTGEAIDPIKLVPEKYRPRAKPVVKTEAQKTHETKCALLMLGTALGDRR